MPPKPKGSKAKLRDNERQKKYFKDDLLQPFDHKGRPNREFIKRWGTSIYNWKKNKV